ncbi:reverse transcriptase domain-containing protein [Tanacetum coccineum]
MTGIPRFVAEHELKTYPHIEPRVQRKRSIAPDRRNVVKEEVEEWLKAGIVKRVRYPTWVANPVLVKKADDSWRMCIDFKDLNKAYPKDLGIRRRHGHQKQTEMDMIKYIEETLLALKKVNMKLNPKKCSFEMEEGKLLGYIVTFEGIRANPEKIKDVIDMPSPSSLKQMQSLSGKLAALNRFLAERAIPSELPMLMAPIKDEELMVYLSAANEVGEEIHYAPMEKLALALVHAARRLRRYFQDYTIKVVTDKHINQILNNREASGRLAKWAIKLGAYSITYAPRNVIKGQLLDDFLADTVTGDDPMDEGIDGPNEPLEGGSAPEALETPGKEKENKATVPEDEAETGNLYTNGASNQHRSGAGLILIDPEGVEYSYALRLNFDNSNNDAEYEALLAGLRIAAEMKVEKGMDIVGPLLEAPGRLKYLIVAVDYFTKWLEAKFGVPVVVITDNVTQLINEPFKSLAENWDLDVGGSSLVYGTEAVIPVKVGMPTRRITQGLDESNEEELRLNLNLLEERRKIAMIREARQKCQVEKYYNQRVCHKQFTVGEFVLRKNEVSKAGHTGKLGPKWEGPYEVMEAYGTGAYKLRDIDRAEIPRT